MMKINAQVSVQELTDMVEGYKKQIQVLASENEGLRDNVYGLQRVVRVCATYFQSDEEKMKFIEYVYGTQKLHTDDFHWLKEVVGGE